MNHQLLPPTLHLPNALDQILILHLQGTTYHEVKNGKATTSHLNRAYRPRYKLCFRRPGAGPVRRYQDSDSGSGSDMEAGLSDVEQEEMRAGRIARKEDLIAEKEEEERKRMKEATKRQREREREKGR